MMRYGMRLSDWSAISYQTLYSRAAVVRRIRGRSAVHAIQQQARINLGINYHCEFGQQVVVVGSSKRLGNWQADDGLVMQWNEGDVWTLDLDLPVEDGIAVEYKYVIRGPDGNITWKPGNNYNIPVPDQDSASWLQAAIAIRDAWDESFRCIHVDTQDNKTVAMEKALEKLDALVSEAMDLEKDPSAPERLAADIEVAEAAKQALQILRAVQAAESSKSLPPGQEG